MKKLKLIFVMIMSFIVVQNFAQSELSPYLNVSGLKGSIEENTKLIEEAINAGGFVEIGEYHPADDPNLFVICFTNDDLKKLSLQFKDRGALASVMKAALYEVDGKITLSILNPEYTFLAYWGEQLNGQESQLKSMSDKIVGMFSSFGNLVPFGGTIDADDLPDYHYMMMMPYFDDPVYLFEFSDFEEGLGVIRENLTAGVGHTVKVFEQTFEGKEIAVFGVGLWDQETGESNFLPTIGESHIANLPYEIILQGKEASMLHGKYRIALYWPELGMGTFMKISGTPGDIEDTMKEVCGEK